MTQVYKHSLPVIRLSVNRCLLRFRTTGTYHHQKGHFIDQHKKKRLEVFCGITSNFCTFRAQFCEGGNKRAIITHSKLQYKLFFYYCIASVWSSSHVSCGSGLMRTLLEVISGVVSAANHTKTAAIKGKHKTSVSYHVFYPVSKHAWKRLKSFLALNLFLLLSSLDSIPTSSSFRVA